MRKLILALTLAMTMSSSVLAAWPMWDQFKAVGMEGARVVDYSDARAVTTSEGQSYAMFFALVDNDRETFEEMLKWTENNLSAGDITKNFAAWLWGKDGSQWTILDTNNAVDSDMWIAYCLLEADAGSDPRSRGMDTCRRWSSYIFLIQSLFPPDEGMGRSNGN